MSSRGGSSCIHVSFPDDGSVDNSDYRSDLEDLEITAAGACPRQYDQTCEDSINTQASDLQTTLTGHGLTATVSASCCENCNVIMCPEDLGGGPATCCDSDGSCTNGDDDYCCGDSYYCSNDGADYARSMNGTLCPRPFSQVMDVTSCTSHTDCTDVFTADGDSIGVTYCYDQGTFDSGTPSGELKCGGDPEACCACRDNDSFDQNAANCPAASSCSTTCTTDDDSSAPFLAVLPLFVFLSLIL